MKKAAAYLVSALACAALGTASAPPARAGGFGFLVESPAAVSTAGSIPEDTMFTLRVRSCYGTPAVMGKAEGLVDGRRVSVPLQLHSLGGDRYAVTRQWPTRGVWVVSLFSKVALPARARTADPIRLTDRMLVHIGSEASRAGLAKTASAERRGVGRDVRWHALGGTGLFYRRPWDDGAALTEATLRAVGEAPDETPQETAARPAV